MWCWWSNRYRWPIDDKPVVAIASDYDDIPAPADVLYSYPKVHQLLLLLLHQLLHVLCMQFHWQEGRRWQPVA